MATQREPVWLDQIGEFGIKSLVKFVLAVFALWFFVVLASFLPGIDRLTTTLSIPFTAIVRTVVTVAILILLYKIATQANTIIQQLRTDSPSVRNCVAAIVYWGVILLAIVAAYEGFSVAGRHLFARAGIEAFYPFFFVIAAMIPLALLIVEVGVFVQARKVRTVGNRVPPSEVWDDTEQVHRLLEERGGRVYQSEVVAATGWSKSKVSRVLSEMESDGVVTRIQVGREKVVCLSGREPDAF